MVDADIRRRSFDSQAHVYDAERPGYPDALFDELIAGAGVARGAAVLEIGCGTGKATRSLLARGLRVTAVELGSNLAALTREGLAGSPLTIHVGRFEDWEAPTAAFDLAVSAQAYHWVEPEVAGRKVAGTLVPGGVLACFWNTELEPVPWLDAQAYAEHAPELEHHDAFRSIEDRIAEQREHVERGGALEVIEVRRYPWTLRRTSDAYVRLLDTYSDHRTLPDPVRARLYPAIRAAIEARGGEIVRPMQAYLLIARARRG